MSQGLCQIWPVATGGPFAYQVTVDGVPQKVATGFATLSAALEDAKPALAAVPGTLRSVTISVQTT